MIEKADIPAARRVALQFIDHFCEDFAVKPQDAFASICASLRERLGDKALGDMIAASLFATRLSEQQIIELCGFVLEQRREQKRKAAS